MARAKKQVAVENVVEKVAPIEEVEEQIQESENLNEYVEFSTENPAYKNLIVYLPSGYIQLKDGKCIVTKATANKLKEMGII